MSSIPPIIVAAPSTSTGSSSLPSRVAIGVSAPNSASAAAALLAVTSAPKTQASDGVALNLGVVAPAPVAEADLDAIKALVASLPPGLRLDVQGMMSTTELLRVLQNIGKILANAGTDMSAENRRRLLDGTIALLIHEGTSPKMSMALGFAAATQSAGNPDVEVRVEIQHLFKPDGIRRFARSFADRAKAIAAAGQMPRMGIRQGFKTAFKSIAFDFSDYCSNLSDDELKELERVKSRVLDKDKKKA